MSELLDLSEINLMNEEEPKPDVIEMFENLVLPGDGYAMKASSVGSIKLYSDGSLDVSDYIVFDNLDYGNIQEVPQDFHFGSDQKEAQISLLNSIFSSIVNNFINNYYEADVMTRELSFSSYFQNLNNDEVKEYEIKGFKSVRNEDQSSYYHSVDSMLVDNHGKNESFKLVISDSTESPLAIERYNFGDGKGE